MCLALLASVELFFLTLLDFILLDFNVFAVILIGLAIIFAILYLLACFYWLALDFIVSASDFNSFVYFLGFYHLQLNCLAISYFDCILHY